MDITLDIDFMPQLTDLISDDAAALWWRLNEWSVKTGRRTCQLADMLMAVGLSPDRGLAAALELQRSYVVTVRLVEAPVQAALPEDDAPSKL